MLSGTIQRCSYSLVNVASTKVLRHYAPLNAGKLKDKKRKRVNSAIKNLVTSNSGKYIANDSCIHVNEIYLFRSDGTHLSDLGNTVLFSNWKAALESFMDNTSEQCAFPATTPFTQ